MKKFKLSGIVISLFCVFAFQNVFADNDVPLRKDDPGPGTQPNIITPMSNMTRFKSSTTTSSLNYIPVNADVVGSELIVDFAISVGTAYVSVVDNNGNLVYQTVVDTFSTSEVVIPVDGMSSGKYSLKITYGSTHLIGDFQL